MPKPSFSRRLQAVMTLLEPRRRELYRYVAGQLQAVGRDEAASAVGMSRAMAAFHLDKLVEQGLLRAEYRRLSGRAGRGAGRPSKLYRRSRRRFDILLPERDHELLARLLAESAGAAPNPSPTREAARRYGRSLGTRARRRLSGAATAQRLAGCVKDVLGDVGFEPLPGEERGETWSRNCPFDPVSRLYPAVVCQTALAIVGGVIDGVGATGLNVRRVDRPDRCCVVLHETAGTAPSRSLSRGRSPKTATHM